MNRVSKAQQLLRASELINNGFGTPIVAAETGLSSQYLRKLYRELQGIPSKSGLLPEANSIVKSRTALLQGSLLASLYLQISGEAIYQRLDIDGLVLAYHNYLALAAEAKLTKRRPWQRIPIDHAWILARDLKAGLARLHLCNCGSP